LSNQARYDAIRPKLSGYVSAAGWQALHTDGHYLRFTRFSAVLKLLTPIEGGFAWNVLSEAASHRPSLEDMRTSVNG